MSELGLMKCIMCNFDDQALEVDTVPIPEPAAGQVLVKVLTCGICGTDLHLRKFGKDLGLPRACLGHEFCCEVVKLGDGVIEDLNIGDRVASMPIVPLEDPLTPPIFLGANAKYYAGFAQYMVLSAKLCNKIPKHVSDEQGALSEPMAVAMHAVNEARYLPQQTVPIVWGCGPVGLTAIVILKDRGYKPIIAVQRSAFRRELAKKLGADIVIDPTAGDGSHVWKAWSEAMAAKLNVTFDEMKDMERGNYSHGELNLVWEPTNGRWCPPLVFENVGVPGMVEQICKDAPRHTRVVMCGYCMQPDTLPHGVTMSKEIEIKCVLGYSGAEFTSAVDLISKLALTEDGKTALDTIITKTVGLDEVSATFDELGSNSSNAKVLVKPNQ